MPAPTASERDARAAKSGYDGSVCGADGRRYRVDADANAYYDEIDRALNALDARTDVEAAAREREAIGGNALEGAEGQERALAMDAKCSRTLEACARAASGAACATFLKKCGESVDGDRGGFYVLAKSLFGSRTLETVMGTLRERHLKTEDEEAEALAKTLREDFIENMGREMVENAVDVAFDKRASPVVRRFLALLAGRAGDKGGADASTGAPSGRNGGKASDGKSLADKLRGGTSSAGKFSASLNTSYRFEEELRKFSDAMLAALEPELWNLVEDTCGSALLQALLKAHEGDDEALNWIIPGLLGCAPAEGTNEGEFLVDAQEWDVKNMMQSRSGSHLMETILAVAPKGLFNEIYRRFFRDKLISTAKHPVSNFVLQAFLGATKDPEHVSSSLSELSQVFGTLLHERRSGVVAATLAACARLKTSEKDAAKALARGLTLKMEARKEGRSQLAPALFWLDTPNYGKCSVLGSAMFQTLFKFTSDCIPMFSESMVSMTDVEVFKVCQDSAGSRAVEAFLASTTIKVNLKKEFIGKLNGRWAQLGLSPVGSHVLEACYREADARGKELILSGLAGQEGPLNATRHGPFLMRRLGVTQFKAAPEQWKNKQKTADAMMGAFEKEFGGEEPKQKESAKRKHKDVSEKEKKPKKEKKEKKVKKEKREKKEKGA
ncbi:Armadillo-type fold [Ostreococcus tauri]|uniref:Armadillo-type fold n=1 Tax=Ostreococcus tauri TaxID=70448 RepID=Q01DX7_OSTTA|nr:Armadillo-type fold [Ostreococcus tauri]CAL52476.1 Armadillo-type fold [Ostreococcus tauri]|eukprot:XP_003075204.1 Armadillo-type fold [Ostreococcus tauri]